LEPSLAEDASFFMLCRRSGGRSPIPKNTFKILVKENEKVCKLVVQSKGENSNICLKRNLELSPLNYCRNKFAAFEGI